MSDFDLTAPSMPYQKKREGGIFKRLFKRGAEQQPEPQAPSPQQMTQTAPQAAQAAAPHEEVNIEEIKRKLGLDDELPALHPSASADNNQWSLPPQPPAPFSAAPQPTSAMPQLAAQPAQVKIDDWTAEGAQTAAQSTSQWATEVAHDAPVQRGSDMHEEHKLEPLPHDHELAPIHHEIVEQHLATIGKSAAKVEETIRKVEQAPLPDVAEWKLQSKEVPPESYFILRNGQPIRSLKELIEALDYIDDSTFDHHVNEYRNDFANWIHDVIQDEDLAARVQDAKDKEGLRSALLAHHKEALKKVTKEQEKLQTIVKKREEALEKLGTVEDQIAQLKKQLEKKSQELLGERKRTAALIKEKLDEEVKRRLMTEKNSLTAARAELQRAKQEYNAKRKEADARSQELEAREHSIASKEQKANSLLHDAEEAQKKLADEKRESNQLLKDAETLRKQFEEMKKLDAQSKRNLEAVAKKEAEMSRREESLAARERKVSSDLTRIQAEQEKLAKLKEEHTKREAAAKAMEADARKLLNDAESRAAAALEEERSTAERMKNDMKKLETLRKVIDQKLGKALGQKKKISDAIALRKELEKAISATKQEVKKEHAEMKEESYKSLIEAKVETTPVGQPAAEEDEMEHVGDKQLPIYQKIAECRMALERKDLQSARVLYNELREEFQKVKVDATERSALYTSIRELYDDIHLMMLG